MEMKTTFYRTGNYKPDYSTFGGTISNYNYDVHETMSDIATRIVSDWKFDERCRKNELNRDRNKNYKKGAM